MKLFWYSLLILLIIVSAVFAQQQPLPHFLTEEEKIIMKDYTPPALQRGIASQPPVAVRTMAEWEELQGIQITWSNYHSGIQRQIIKYAQEEGWVYIVCSDSNSVKQHLNNYGVPRIRWKFVKAASNSLWCRDYGPWTAYAENSDSLFIIDMLYNRPRPSDDLIPGVIASMLNVPLYGAVTYPDNLTHTGGNFMVDGHGTGFMSKLVLNENPGKTNAQIDDIFSRYFGLDRVVKMETLPYDQIHHIDMHMKLLDEETLLVGQYPDGVADGPQIESNLQYVLNNFKTCFGRDYKVVRIPMPPDASGAYPHQWGDYRTYTNSLIVNKTVIMPTYEYKHDTTAFRIYREAMPGYRIVGINSNSIIPSLGTIHCITKEVGAENPIHISHKTIRAAADTTAGFPVIAKIRTNSGVDSASVFWSTDTTAGFNRILMTTLPGDSFSAVIPQQGGGVDVFYYISATSNLGKTIVKPLVAPAGSWKFNIDILTNIENEIALAQNWQLYQNYPNPFNPETQLTFVAPQSGEVKLVVYDLLGRAIKTLLNENIQTGEHQVQWNGRDNHGNAVPSGIYFYRLSGNGSSQMKKMMLVK